MIALLWTERRRRVPARCAVCGEAPEMQLSSGALLCEPCCATSERDFEGRTRLVSTEIEPGREVMLVIEVGFVPTRICVAPDSSYAFVITRIAVREVEQLVSPVPPALFEGPLPAGAWPRGRAVVGVANVSERPCAFVAALVEARDW